MYNFGSYTLKIKTILHHVSNFVAVFHQNIFTHGKGHQMMTFRAGCGPLVHVNATSQNSACVFLS